MVAIEKSNNGLSPPPKLLISHGLPVLSCSNPQVVRKPLSEYHYPPPPQKKTKQKKHFGPPPTINSPKQNKGTQRKNGKKRKKEGTIFANPPSEDPLVDEPL